MADDAPHRPLEQHPHVHDRFCGHAAVPHEDHDAISSAIRRTEMRRPSGARASASIALTA